MWATQCMSYIPACNTTLCKPTSRLLIPCTAWQQVYHVLRADLSMWKHQRYKGLPGCFGLSCTHLCMCRFMWGKGLLQKPLLQPCQLASTAKPLLMAHRYSMRDCTLKQQLRDSQSCMQSHHEHSFVAIQKLPSVRSGLPS